ncbi:MAG: restriction endonuclease subunit S [Dehalococcoides mccartyi]|uniref:restriction endonuclease subunit S n=1 Tax=Dehalococcoides mccartyi TaxID=61435 RepID=UPI0025CB2998|nr:restriction endonuclease subunit S [Dehalococcoides mccartyi]MDN4186772.1 restriction endonuclease subunit S [Dehalococcoides mccartyi]
MTEEIKSRIEQIKAGQVPEGYKQVHSGTIPVDWNEATISNIADEITDTAGEGEYETLSISAGIGFVNQAQKFGREKSGAQYAKYTVLHRGDFSYNKGNSNLYPQGCIYRLNDRKEAAVPNVFESFRFTAQDGDYYEQLFVNGFLNKQLYSKINHGVRDDGLLNLTGSDFYSCCLPVPPLPEQKKIAEILRQCDKVIELKQSKIEELQELKKTCLSKMFPKEGHNVPELRFPGFTDAWEQRKLGDISDSYSGGTPTAGKAEYYGGEIPFIRSAEINSDITELYLTEEGLQCSSAKMVNKGDILYALYGATSGETGLARLDGAINQAIIDIKPHKDFDAYFVMQWLRKSKEAIISTYLQGGQGNLSGAIVTSLIIDYPQYTEQKAIGASFRNLDNLLTLHQRELEETQKYKKALMQLLLMGIVRVK